MCIIVDANVASELVTPSEDGAPVLHALVSKKLVMVCGGRLKTELGRTSFRRLYRQLVLAGSVREYMDPELANELGKLPTAEMRSDDPHILCLASISGARLLFSRDRNLHADFKNKKLLGGVKGKIYQRATQSRSLLREGTCSCSRGRN